MLSEIIQEIEALKAVEDDLRNKISLLEKKLEDALNREKNLEKEIVEWEEKYEALSKELQRVRDELEIVRIDAEKVKSIFYSHFLRNLLSQRFSLNRHVCMCALFVRLKKRRPTFTKNWC